MRRPREVAPPDRRAGPGAGASLRIPALVLLLALAAGHARGADAPEAAPGSPGLPESEYHLLSGDVRDLPLAHAFVVPGSVELIVEGRTWREGEEYRVRAREGVLTFLQPLPPAVLGGVLVLVRYRFLPVPVAPQVDLHIPRPAPAAADSALDEEPAPAAAGTAPAVGDLTVRGSKSVLVSSGNRRDLTVDQTLRLTIAGQLTEDITVNAALSDDNLPVVPEGNTEELRDVDKVLVQLRAPTWQADLGDFVAERTGTVFGDYRRKLQGAALRVGGQTRGGSALAGSPRGVYRTVQLRGEEDNQGPYRLDAGEIGGDVYIVAGSERVSLDGERLTRGADRDYVIDYVRGTVTFTYRRLITAESTIVVEFEQGEGPYARSVVGAEAWGGGEVPLFGLEGGLGFRITREEDDPQRLRTGELDDEARALLEAAGDDPVLAVAGGVVETEPGAGDYDRRVRADGVVLYEYAEEGGDYDLSFFFVGEARGDYRIDRLTAIGERVFVYAGADSGSYRIGSPLPLPESHEMLTATARLGSRESPRLSAEWNLSRRDLNQLSSLDDGDNDGSAWVVRARTGEGELAWGGRSLGRFSLEGRHESRGARFTPYLLHKDLFRYDAWGLAGRARRPGFLQQRDAESEVRGLWLLGDEARRLRVETRWGSLLHGDDLEAGRLGAAAEWRWGGGDGRSTWEAADSRDRRDPLDARRRRERHELAWNVWVLRPQGFVDRDEWRDDAAAADSVAGARVRRWGLALGSRPGLAWSWKTGWEHGRVDSLRAGAWRRRRESKTARGELTSPRFLGMRATANATVREVRPVGLATQTTYLGKLDLSGAWPRAGSDWNLSYRVDSSRSQILDRQVVFVGFRQGDYDQNGTFVGRNQGDYTITLVGTDETVATTGAGLDLAWRQDFGFLGRRRVWGAWSSQTRLALSGRSTTDDVGRLLRFAPGALFHPEDTVLGEVSLQQELDLLRHLRTLDLRLRFDYDESLDRQYSSHPESRQRRLHAGTLTWSATTRASLQGRLTRTDDERRTREEAGSPQQSYDAIIWQGELEGAFRPRPGDRLSLAGEHVRRRDAESGVEQREWAVRPGARLRLRERWTANAELRWSQVASEEPTGAIRPFFFAFPGRNVEASARVAFEPSRQLTVSLGYFGRKQGERGWQHDVRMESTARF